MKAVGLQPGNRRWIPGPVVRVLCGCIALILLGSCVKVAEVDYPSLRDSINPDFQAAFEKTLAKQFGQKILDIAKTKKVSIVLADITDPHKPQVAEVNGDIMLYAASLPKIAIVLGVFEEMERAKMKMTVVDQSGNGIRSITSPTELPPCRLRVIVIWQQPDGWWQPSIRKILSRCFRNRPYPINLSKV